MEDNPTPSDLTRLDRVLEVLAWAFWAFLAWHLIGFTLEAFSPLWS